MNNALAAVSEKETERTKLEERLAAILQETGRLQDEVASRDRELYSLS